MLLLISLLVSILFSLHGHPLVCFFFFFNDTATTEIYTLSLHDALPISLCHQVFLNHLGGANWHRENSAVRAPVSILILDRKSTRLNSSHSQISYAVFCLKKKTTLSRTTTLRSRSSISSLSTCTISTPSY